MRSTLKHHEAGLKIVVATDGSRGAAAAVRFAARLATRDPKSELLLLTVAHPRAKEALREAARELKGQGLAKRSRYMTLRTRQPIPEAIAALADRVKADLVVVGSEGRDTLNEWVVGGVALRLIYVARRPVTVVRPPRRRRS